MAVDPADLFARPTDMSDRTQGEINEDDYPYLERELAAATEDIRDFCRWHVYPQKPVEYRRVGASPDDVWLPAMRIKSIDAVTIDGVEYDAAALDAVEFDPTTGWTNLCGRNVAVTYTAGYATVPPNLETAALELAASALGTSLGHTREQAGSVSLTYGRAGGGIDESTPGGQRLVAYRIGRLP